MVKPLIIIAVTVLSIPIFGCQKRQQPEVHATQEESESYSDNSMASQRIDTVAVVLGNIDLLRSIPRGADMLMVRRHIESKGLKWDRSAFEIMQRAGLSNTIKFSNDSTTDLDVDFYVDFDGNRFSRGHMSIWLPDSVALNFYKQLTGLLTARFHRPTIQISKVEQPYRADEIFQALRSEKAQLESRWRLSKAGESLSMSLFPMTGSENSLTVFIEYRNSK